MLTEPGTADRSAGSPSRDTRAAPAPSATIDGGTRSVSEGSAPALDWGTEMFSGDDMSPDARIDDGIVTKDGKVIELSPDDNVYATKNEPKVVRDQEAQRAMPDVPRTPAEFTDAGIISAIQVLTDVLRNKDMVTNVSAPEQSVNFDQFRMAGALI